MTRTVRLTIFAAAAAVLAGLLFWSVAGLPDFGHYHWPYGRVLNAVAVAERHTTNAVAATVFDFRGLDTMGEELILFGAVVGVAMLLRAREQDNREHVGDEVGSDAVRLVGLLLVGPALLLALWLVSFGYVTPGGGFQGGVAIAGAIFLVYAASSFRSYSALTPKPALDFLEGVGAGGYVVIGLAALISGLPFLHNLLGPGEKGTLLSGGSIPFLNWASAIEVAAANLLLFAEFLEEYIVPLARERAP